MSFIAASSAGRAGVGQQRHLAAVLHCDGDVALMLRAVARHPTRADLAAVGDELAQKRRVLVVDVGRLLLAEDADLFLGLAKWWLGHGRQSSFSQCGEERLEGRLVSEVAAGRGSGPRVVGGRAAATAEAAATAAAGGVTAAATTAHSATTLRLGDLRS